MVRVLIADDHAIVREGLRRILSEEPLFEVVGEAADSQEALDLTKKTNPDVVLLDISMPGRGGIETLKEIKARRARTHVLMLSMHPEDQFALRCLRDGADGYMTKESAPDELIGAIRKISQGGKYVSTALAEKMAFSLDANFERAPHETLSDREFQVLCMIARGLTVSEIGEELALSVKTISTYRSRILEKMQLKNNAELMHYAIQRGLVE